MMFHSNDTSDDEIFNNKSLTTVSIMNGLSVRLIEQELERRVNETYNGRKIGKR